MNVHNQKLEKLAQRPTPVDSYQSAQLNGTHATTTPMARKDHILGGIVHLWENFRHPIIDSFFLCASFLPQMFLAVFGLHAIGMRIAYSFRVVCMIAAGLTFVGTLIGKHPMFVTFNLPLMVYATSVLVNSFHYRFTQVLLFSFLASVLVGFISLLRLTFAIGDRIPFALRMGLSLGAYLFLLTQSWELSILHFYHNQENTINFVAAGGMVLSVLVIIFSFFLFHARRYISPRNQIYHFGLRQFQLVPLLLVGLFIVLTLFVPTSVKNSPFEPYHENHRFARDKTHDQKWRTTYKLHEAVYEVLLAVPARFFFDALIVLTIALFLLIDNTNNVYMIYYFNHVMTKAALQREESSVLSEDPPDPRNGYYLSEDNNDYVMNMSHYHTFDDNTRSSQEESAGHFRETVNTKPTPLRHVGSDSISAVSAISSKIDPNAKGEAGSVVSKLYTQTEEKQDDGGMALPKKNWPNNGFVERNGPTLKLKPHDTSTDIGGPRHHLGATISKLREDISSKLPNIPVHTNEHLSLNHRDEFLFTLASLASIASSFFGFFMVSPRALPSTLLTPPSSMICNSLLETPHSVLTNPFRRGPTSLSTYGLRSLRITALMLAAVAFGLPKQVIHLILSPLCVAVLLFWYGFSHLCFAWQHMHHEYKVRFINSAFSGAEAPLSSLLILASIAQCVFCAGGAFHWATLIAVVSAVLYSIAHCCSRSADRRDGYEEIPIDSIGEDVFA